MLGARWAYDCAGRVSAACRASAHAICICHLCEPVFAMEIQVAGQDISPEAFTAEPGWITARSRRSTDNSTPTDEPRSPARQPVLKAGRMPQLPMEGSKIVIRPKGALHIAKRGSPVVTAAILQAVNLTDEESLEDTVCPNTQQSIVVVSTPHPEHADRYVRIPSIQVNSRGECLRAHDEGDNPRYPTHGHPPSRFNPRLETRQPSQPSASPLLQL
ncbi:hypothetical protein MTO96_025596 [Rhipicephalus appendiculatus]